jgi:hypothetical protein
VSEPGDAQRRMRQGHIHMIAGDIEAERWVFNAQPFIFDDSSPRAKLLDGRHRANAVIIANRSVEALCVYGVAIDGFYTMDQSTGRTKEDALSAMGYDDARTLGSAAYLLWHYLNGGITRGNQSRRLSPVASIEIVQQYPGLVDALLPGKAAKKVCHSAGVPAFCYYVFAQIDESAARAFFHRLATGEELKSGNAILCLRNRFLSGDRFYQGDSVYLIFKAWNQWRKGKHCITLQVKPNEPFPTPI